MKQISDAKVYDALTSPKDDLAKIRKEQEELRKKVHKLMADYIEVSKANDNVYENGKIRFFPQICDTPDLILKQYPMTEEQILSVKDYDNDLLYDAIDFLHGENKGKLASTCICVFMQNTMD